MNKNNKIQIKEATSDSGSKGSYVGPMQLGVRKFKKSEMSPFTIPVSKYDSPELEFDSYDGSMDETKKEIKKIEGKAKKITNYMTKHPELTNSDEDGSGINPTPGKNKKVVPIKENTTANSAGEYTGPIELGLKKWRKSELFPFINQSSHKTNKKSKSKKLKNNVDRVVGMWEKGVNGSYNIDTHDVNTVKEWVEVTEGTVLGDIVPNGLKTGSNYDRVIDKFRKNIPEDKMKEYNLISEKIKDFIQDRGYTIKVLNSCNTGFKGVRTSNMIILCSPDMLPNFASFVYILFHELKHEQQMSDFDMKDSYMGDIEDFEEFFKIYWDMEMDADNYGKDWVKKIGNVLKLPTESYHLDKMIESYPTMSNMIRQMMLHLHREVQTLKSKGFTYTDIGDLDIVKKHLNNLEDMF
jgi:protein-tyrosine-phosphatase